MQICDGYEVDVDDVGVVMNVGGVLQMNLATTLREEPFAGTFGDLQNTISH